MIFNVNSEDAMTPCTLLNLLMTIFSCTIEEITAHYKKSNGQKYACYESWW